MSWDDLIFLCKKMMFFKAKKKKKTKKIQVFLKNKKTNPGLGLLTRLGLISLCNLNNIDKKCNDN